MDVPVVVDVPGHYRIRETYDRSQHHEVVVEPKAELTVAGYHDAVSDVVVVQHGHVGLPVVFVRADEPARFAKARWCARQNGAAHRPNDISQRHFYETIQTVPPITPQQLRARIENPTTAATSAPRLSGSRGSILPSKFVSLLNTVIAFGRAL